MSAARSDTAAAVLGGSRPSKGNNGIRKALAALALGATLSMAPAADGVLAQDADTEEEDDSGNWGLLGLIGLVGLAGLAGLKRRKDTGYTAGYTATPGDAVAPNIHGATGRSVDS